LFSAADQLGPGGHIQQGRDLEQKREQLRQGGAWIGSAIARIA
jgi:hypothetical protein